MARVQITIDFSVPDQNMTSAEATALADAIKAQVEAAGGTFPNGLYNACRNARNRHGVILALIQQLRIAPKRGGNA